MGLSTGKKEKGGKKKECGRGRREAQGTFMLSSSLLFYQEKGVQGGIKGFFLKDKEKM